MKLWKGKKEESKPKPYLHLQKVAFGKLTIVALNSEGDIIAFICGESGYSENAKGRIESSGYSTSWAEWDKDGRFVRMLEEIEE